MVDVAREVSSESPATESPEARALAEARERAVPLYRHMLRLRMISSRMVALQHDGEVAFHASCIGEESAIVAACLAARKQDWVFPGAREWGAALVRGLPTIAYMHHAFGTRADTARGHAPPDYHPARTVRVGMASGVAGAHLPQAVGMAWAARTRRDDVVTVALAHDGLRGSGDFHNALNFAGVFKAPCVVVCRSDGRSLQSTGSRAVDQVSDIAVAYGLASGRVDGADALATLALVRQAVQRAAEGRGGTLIEVVTRPVESLEGRDLLALGQDDPLVVLRRVLTEDATLDAPADDAMRASLRAEIEQAVAEASLAPPPDPRSMFDHVYATVPAHLVAQRNGFIGTP